MKIYRRGRPFLIRSLKLADFIIDLSLSMKFSFYLLLQLVNKAMLNIFFPVFIIFPA
jgi:hypothetical protein